jgi:hypothetical protein
MADYHSPTVVDPEIPIADVTALERLLLEAIYDVDERESSLFLSHWEGINDYPDIDRSALVAALADATRPSRIADHITAILAGDAEDLICLALDTVDACPDTILQDIVRRSPTLSYLTVTTAFTCTKMRVDAFGGSATLIAANTILSKSTNTLFDEFFATAQAAGDILAS